MNCQERFYFSPNFDDFSFGGAPDAPSASVFYHGGLMIDNEGRQYEVNPLIGSIVGQKDGRYLLAVADGFIGWVYPSHFKVINFVAGNTKWVQ